MTPIVKLGFKSLIIRTSQSWSLLTDPRDKDLSQLYIFEI